MNEEKRLRACEELVRNMGEEYREFATATNNMFKKIDE